MLLSVTQQRFWFLEQYDSGNPSHMVAAAYRLQGHLNTAMLANSLQDLIQRHPLLRATFPAADGQPVVKVAESEVGVGPTFLDLSGQVGAEGEASLGQTLTQWAQQPFDLATGPLWRAVLVRVAADHHVLMFALHRIVGDEASLDLLAGDLAELYSSASQEGAAALPDLTASFGRWLEREQVLLAAPDAELHLKAVQQRLAGAPTVVDLDTDQSPPPVRSGRSGQVVLPVPGDIAQQAAAYAHAAEVDLASVWLAGLAAFLYRYTGQEDLLVGEEISGRDGDWAGVVGPLGNTRILRAGMTYRTAGRALVEQLFRQRQAAMGEGNLPFGTIVETLKIQRDPSRPPLVQVALEVQPEAPARRLSGLTMAPMAWHNGASEYDLKLVLRETTTGQQAHWIYNTDLFHESTVSAMATHVHELLRSITGQPDQLISNLPMLTAEEQRQVVVEWNDTHTVVPPQRCMHQYFEAQVQRTPMATAALWDEVVFQPTEQRTSRAITYAELDEKANRLARHLVTMGVGPEVTVGLCVPRTVHMLLGMLAILKAGGTYVPLDPAYPQERIQLILDDSQASIILTLEAQREVLPAHGATVVCLDADWPIIAQQEATTPSTSVDPQNIAYLIYTSGSTGRPKGVAITHYSAAVFMEWSMKVFSPAEMAGVLAGSSMCFDLSVFEIFVPLACGGTVILAENLLELPSLTVREQVTLINSVPSVMAALMSIGGVPSSVQVVNLAGEALKNELVQEIYQRTTVRDVYNLYGPSEDTTYSTFTRVERGVNVTIGGPIANTGIYLVDANLNPVPVGVKGEICIGGHGLARGYLNRPDLTAEKFVPNPFSLVPGARMYRTGDLGRYQPDGSLLYLGRVDYQIKIRGFRIEPGEIEAVLMGHPGVFDVVVMARNTPDDQSKRLVAYAVAQPGYPLSLTELRSFLAARLPGYLVPSAWMMLDAMPKGATGKVDRKALPEPDPMAYGTSAAFVAPRNAVEEVIASVCAEVLHLPRISVHGNFFDMGGQSLSAVQVISRLRKILQVDLTVKHLFESPTVDQLAVLARAREPQPGQVEKAAAVWRRVKSLSSADLKANLAQLRRERGSGQ
ncbi:MAG TPA: amino acid adenylation domain-containing protein [Symbiobacteriaceae bacterium]|nr:amino acid adenylation domain-containing protein [Symbiobacteriaceae bacterium]